MDVVALSVVLHLVVSLVSSTILEEEKVQQKERNRMEMRRQVTVSWDSGGSDEAPPKVRQYVTPRIFVSVSSEWMCLWLEKNWCTVVEFTSGL